MGSTCLSVLHTPYARSFIEIEHQHAVMATYRCKFSFRLILHVFMLGLMRALNSSGVLDETTKEGRKLILHSITVSNLDSR